MRRPPFPVGYRAGVTVHLPRTPRIASPGFHRSVGFDVLALLVVAFLAPFVTRVGGAAMLVGIALAFAVGYRRQTVGAYDGEHGLVVRNFLRTHLLPWPVVASVKIARDPVFPWLRVPAVVLHTAATGETRAVCVSGLRHLGEPNTDVMSLTRVVREGRDGLSREVWE
jgi:hypothetical protein